MKRFLAAATIAPLLALGTLPAASAADLSTYQAAPQPVGPSGGVRIGYLDCAIGSGLGYVFGSAKAVDCVFHSSSGQEAPDHYSGTIRKLGVDLGYTSRGRLIWAVFAPTAGYHEGSLGGLYEGVTAQATLGVGPGVNILVGGTAGSIHLQTISVTGQVGLNVAAAGTSMTLNALN